MLWFWGACGAFAFGALPLGVTLFGASKAQRNAGLYTFVVNVITGAIFGQVFGVMLATALSQGVTLNGMRLAVRMNDLAGATTIGLGVNVWWPVAVRRVTSWIEKGKA